MKYTTPSIEVVTFNPSDAPRIGMQWWYWADRGQYAPFPANYPRPTEDVQPHGHFDNFDAQGLNCPSVEIYTCAPETALNGYLNGQNRLYVADDGKSC